VIREGLRAAWTQRRLCLAIYAAGLVLAFVAAAPSLFAIDSAAALIPLADRLEGSGLDVYAAVTILQEVDFRPAVATALLFVLGAHVLGLWVIGGLLAALRRGGPATLGRFFAGASATFLPMVRLQFLALIAYGVALGLLLAGGALGGWLGESAVLAQAPALWRVGLALPGLAVLLMVSTAVGYGRIGIPRGCAAVAALTDGLMFVVRHPLRTLSLHVAFGSMCMALTALGATLVRLPLTGNGGALSLFLMLQALAVARAFVGVAGVAGSLTLVREIFEGRPGR